MHSLQTTRSIRAMNGTVMTSVLLLQKPLIFNVCSLALSQCFRAPACNYTSLLIGCSHFTSHSSVCQVIVLPANFCSSVLYPLQTIYKCAEQYRSATTLVSYWRSEDWLLFCYHVFLSLWSVILKQPSLLFRGCLVHLKVFDQKFCQKSFGNPGRLDHLCLHLCLASSKNSTKFLSPKFSLQKHWCLLPERSRSSMVSLLRLFTNCSVHILSSWNDVSLHTSEPFHSWLQH